MSDEDMKQAYWKRIRRATLGTTAVLAGITIVLPLFVPDLNGYRFMRLPFGYFLLADGSVLGLAILLYAFFSSQKRNDRAYNVTIQF
jgi:putative solute:sodium symporter small subunit